VTPAAARAAVEQAIYSAWGSTTTIAWPNVAFTPPSGSAKWLKVDWIWGNGNVQTKGVTGGRNVVTGVLQLAIYGPKDQGDGALDILAETARAIFNRKRLASPNADVMFGAASGPVRLFEESWRSLVVSVPFRVEETVT
jgi:hypothetical protein